MNLTVALSASDWRSPIVMDAHGSPRIGGTRVTLDSIVGSHRQGNSPEEISRQFDTVSLADIYSTIAFYLRNRDLVDAYIAEIEELAVKYRAENAEFHQKMSERMKSALKHT